MELSPKQQVTELVKKFSRVLIVSHARPDGDALGGVLALQHVLTALGKEAHTVVTDPVNPMFDFLPGIGKLSDKLSGSRDLIVSVDTTKTPVDKLKYNTRDGKLNVIITPKTGSYVEEDVAVSVGSYKYDLIIVLDAPDLDRLGKVYEEHPELFYETPVVNIDHHPSNDYFGAVNLVDLTATSTCEILVGVIEALGDSLMTEDVATCLLTGLITDTGSFQNSNTTPKSLTVSAQLVAAGGHQQEIVQHVYKTKPLSTLKLWGRALTKLQYDPEARLVWSSISAKDFSDTGGTPSEAKEVIDALMSSAPDAEIILLLRENEGKIDASVRTTKGVDALKVVGFWNGGGHKAAAGFDVPGPLADAERKVVKQVRAWQIERLENKGELPKEPEITEEPDPTRRPTPATVEEALHIAKQVETPDADAAASPRETQRPVRPEPQPQQQAKPAENTQGAPEVPAQNSPTPSPTPASTPQPAKPTQTAEPARETPAPNPPASKPVSQSTPQPAESTSASPQPKQTAPANAPEANDPHAPLSDEELDAYFRKTLGGKDDMIDQPDQPSKNQQDE